MLTPAFSAAVVALAFTIGWGGNSGAAEPAEASSSQYVRLVRDGKRAPVAMETSIVRFAGQDAARRPITVDLVAAVHIADKGYYQDLNRRFEGYDAVLYELVAPEGTRVPKGGRKEINHPVTAMQKGMTGVLGLEYQLDQIDYTKKNLFHADMSPEQFAKSMQNRGESFSAMFARMIGYALANQNESSGAEADLVLALFNKNRSLALKRVVAEQFEQMDWMIEAMDGPKGSTLIGERNKAALEVLRKQTAAGKRNLAIFYGAAHMPDFQKRLEKEFGLARTGARWLVAWNLKGATR